MARAWSDEWRARDGDGLLHQLSAIEPDDRLLGYLGAPDAVHRRWPPSLRDRAGLPGRGAGRPALAGAAPGALAADWIMMMVVNAELTELEIRPTHRLLLDADADALRALAAGDDPLFEAIPCRPTQLATRSRSVARRAAGLRPRAARRRGISARRRRRGLADRLRRERMAARGARASTSPSSTWRSSGTGSGSSAADVAAGDAPRLH